MPEVRQCIGKDALYRFRRRNSFVWRGFLLCKWVDQYLEDPHPLTPSPQGEEELEFLLYLSGERADSDG